MYCICTVYCILYVRAYLGKLLYKSYTGIEGIFVEGIPYFSPPSGAIPNRWELIADGTFFDLEKIVHGALSALMKKIYLFEG